MEENIDLAIALLSGKVCSNCRYFLPVRHCTVKLGDDYAYLDQSMAEKRNYMGCWHFRDKSDSL